MAGRILEEKGKTQGLNVFISLHLNRIMASGGAYGKYQFKYYRSRNSDTAV